MAERRLVILVNGDVKMTRGKYASQAVHAALLALNVHQGCPVVVLGGKARDIEGMPMQIRDAGRTEVEAGTLTAGAAWEGDPGGWSLTMPEPTSDERLVVPCARCSRPILPIKSETPDNEELDVCGPCGRASATEALDDENLRLREQAREMAETIEQLNAEVTSLRAERDARADTLGRVAALLDGSTASGEQKATKEVTVNERIDQYAAEVAEMAQWIPEGQIVRRRVTYSEWYPVRCTHDADCLLHLDRGVH